MTTILDAATTTATIAAYVVLIAGALWFIAHAVGLFDPPRPSRAQVAAWVRDQGGEGPTPEEIERMRARINAELDRGATRLMKAMNEEGDGDG